MVHQYLRKIVVILCNQIQWISQILFLHRRASKIDLRSNFSINLINLETEKKRRKLGHVFKIKSHINVTNV